MADEIINKVGPTRTGNEKKGKPPKNKRYKPGSFPPYIKLSDAFKLALDINHQAGGRASMSALSVITKNSPSSSSFTKKAGALKAYGLVVEQEGQFILTDIGNSITAPTSAEACAAAKKDAFLRIEIFSNAYERYKGKLLPDDEFLKNSLVQEFSVPRELAESWMDGFKDGLTSASLALRRSDGKTQILENANIGAVGKSVLGGEDQPPATPPKIDAPKGVTGSINEHEAQRIPISLGVGKRAYVELPQNWDTKDLLRLLRLIALSIGEGEEYTIETKLSPSGNEGA